MQFEENKTSYPFTPLILFYQKVLLVSGKNNTSITTQLLVLFHMLINLKMISIYQMLYKKCMLWHTLTITDKYQDFKINYANIPNVTKIKVRNGILDTSCIHLFPFWLLRIIKNYFIEFKRSVVLAISTCIISKKIEKFIFQIKYHAILFFFKTLFEYSSKMLWLLYKSVLVSKNNDFILHGKKVCLDRRSLTTVCWKWSPNLTAE